MPFQAACAATCSKSARRPHFPVPSFDILTTVSAQRDPPGPKYQLVLLIEHLQSFAHENTPVSRIVYANSIYYPLLYGSIVAQYEAYCISWLGFTITISRFQPDDFSLTNEMMTMFKPGTSVSQCIVPTCRPLQEKVPVLK